ncbi:cobalamin B12-binding domain-containing protein [Streptomyces sp. NA02950]|uniref:cobalamin-dependent protein n=1 Tax=Streptomyces sp. NA02950 TaxID=2742137 RepID=UPI001592A014|nr:cobalamin-dependent protein [Streptomyces sp. NA02950]QKV91471.1 cobalamin B12-binding domain-containing protein [Streptomyces sp. NA02950]
MSSAHTTAGRRLVILGVAASDCHVVANQLIAYALRGQGFEVVNLGACTPVEEFARAYREHPEAEAILIGSLNGHVHEDLRDLPEARRSGRIGCPVVVGGNLSVGSVKDPSAVSRLYDLGVDRIVEDPDDLPAVLDRLRATRAEVARVERSLVS